MSMVQTPTRNQSIPEIMNINEGDEMDSILDEEELAENPRSINASQINQKETALNEKSLMRELSKLAAEQSTQETHLAST